MIYFDLQLFAEEVADSTPVSTESSQVATGSEATEPVMYTKRGTPIYDPTKQTGNNSSFVAEEETFDSLIKGKYKDDYNKAVEKAIKSRFKNQKAQEERLASYNPLLEALATRYGMNAEDLSALDINALTENVIADRKYLEDEALQRGLSLDDMQHIKELEYRDEQRKRMESASIEEQKRRAEFDALVKAGEEIKKDYPDFDLGTEIDNRQFMLLLQNGFDARSAYEATHLSSIKNALSRSAEAKVVNNIQSGMSRPQENGLNSVNGGITQENIHNKEYREMLKKKARMGEKVVL